ncbi:MAG: NifB/NifX family molybdenum-iron cluster-binding protein [Elusimicrobiota bacterium]|nr:NifB/NifX family molybdenum-iron cluster-binding protein [Elusimicrobiota bacterium]
MRVAIPIWEERISPVFDTAEKILISDFEQGKVNSRFIIPFQVNFLPQRAAFLRRFGVQILICGGISTYLARLVAAQGIRVIAGLSGNIDEVLRAYFQGNMLENRYLMPGWRGWKRRRYGRGRYNF